MSAKTGDPTDLGEGDVGIETDDPVENLDGEPRWLEIGHDIRV
jgi:hypothetical protein